MTRPPGSVLALFPGLVACQGVAAACLVLASHPDAQPLAQFEGGDAFALAYVHSVTRTPVEERYRIDGATIVQTEIRFAQHGPGLPTEADAGGAWRQEDGRFVVTTARRFDSIALRVQADQQWRMTLAGDPRSVNLAQWGDRALALAAHSGACRTGPAGHGARVQ